MRGPATGKPEDAQRPGDSVPSKPGIAAKESAAEPGAEPLRPMPEYETVVTATRFDTALGNVPAVVSVVSGRDARARPVANADDLIRSSATADGQRYQGIGNAYPHMLSVRGIRGPDRLLVLLDGQPINNAINGFPDLNLLPVDRVARVEFVRGPFSALYGSQAMAGVVNVITERGSQNPGARLQSEVGPHGAHVLGGSVADGWGPAEITLSYDRRQTDNYLANSLEPNVDYRHHRLHTRVDLFRGGALSGTITGGLFRSDMGFDQYVDLRSIPGLGFWLRNEGRSAMNDGWAQVALAWKVLAPMEVHITGSMLRHEQRFHASAVLLEGEYPTGYVPAPELVTSDSVAWRGEALVRWSVSDWLATVLGGDVVRSGGEWRTVDLVDGRLKTGMDASATTEAVFAQMEATLLDRRLRVIGGARVDHHSTFGTALSPKIGLSHEVHDGTVLRASFGRAFRSPSLTELYQPAWQRIPPYQTVGNEALRPEMLYAVDGGVEQHFGRSVRARATGFYNQGRDLISLLLQSDNQEHYLNQGRIRTAGVELEATVELGERLRLFPSYTYTFSQSEETGKPLDYVAAHVAGLSVIGRLPVATGALEAALDVHMVGRREYAEARNPTARHDLGAHTVGNLRAQWILQPSVAFFADFFNLWDARYLENEGISAPRFQFLAGVRVEAQKPR